MKKYLVTGLSGTGKSTIAKELQNRGSYAVDTDKADGLCRWINIDTGKGVKHKPNDKKWYEKNHLVWDKSEMLRIFQKTDQGNIFICGSSYNDSEFYNLFDKIFFLVVDKEALVSRLGGRHGKQFGKNEIELTEILKWHKKINYSKLAARFRGKVIDAALPPSKIADQILAQT